MERLRNSSSALHCGQILRVLKSFMLSNKPLKRQNTQKQTFGHPLLNNDHLMKVSGVRYCLDLNVLQNIIQVNDDRIIIFGSKPFNKYKNELVQKLFGT